MGTFTKLTYHVVYSTKYRRRTITDKIRVRLYEYSRPNTMVDSAVAATRLSRIDASQSMG